jgi:type IV pilus assembly protein PilV
MSIKSWARQPGFTMVEVLVTLVIVAIGLLGIAAVQILSLNNTGIARNRSLAALQADGLASMMHANQVYWQSATVATGVDITSSTLTTATICCATAVATSSCSNIATSSVCSAPVMAAYDLQQWATGVSASLPSGSGKVNCVAGGNPVNCAITVSWIENNVALNSSSNIQDTSSTSTTPFGINYAVTQTYTLVVQP